MRRVSNMPISGPAAKVVGTGGKTVAGGAAGLGVGIGMEELLKYLTGYDLKLTQGTSVAPRK